MSDNLPWKTWTPDDLAPPQAEFVPLMEPEETVTEEAEPSLEQQLAQLQMQAHEQGYQAGIAEGRQQGHEQGYQEGLAQGLEQGLAQAKSQQAPIHARMQQLVSEFQTTLDALDSVIASRLMQMALEAARQVIGQTPTVDNSALIKQIQQLLQQEPLFSGKPQLRVHPDDLQRVDEMLGATLSCMAGACAATRPSILAVVKSPLMKAISTPVSPPAGKNSAVWQRQEWCNDHAPDTLANHAG